MSSILACFSEQIDRSFPHLSLPKYNMVYSGNFVSLFWILVWILNTAEK
jgi:hypothetical protein